MDQSWRVICIVEFEAAGFIRIIVHRRCLSPLMLTQVEHEPDTQPQFLSSTFLLNLQMDLDRMGRGSDRARSLYGVFMPQRRLPVTLTRTAIWNSRSYQELLGADLDQQCNAAVPLRQLRSTCVQQLAEAMHPTPCCSPDLSTRFLADWSTSLNVLLDQAHQFRVGTLISITVDALGTTAVVRSPHRDLSCYECVLSWWSAFVSRMWCSFSVLAAPLLSI